MKKVIFLGLILLILSGCNLKQWFEKEEESRKDIDKTYTVTVPVVVSPAQKTTLIKHIKTSGRAEAIKKTAVIAEISGKIEQIDADENTRLQKDDIILTIDADDLRLDLQKTRLDYQKALAEYNAWKKLNAGEDDEKLKLQTGLKEKEILLEKLALKLDKAMVKMPFSGIVTEFDLVIGEYVNQGQKLFTAVDNKSVLVRVNVLESEVNRIRPGYRAKMVFPALKDKIYTGKIKSISPLVDKDNHTCEVIVMVRNDGNIKDGMYADVKLNAEQFKDKIIIYKDAVLLRDEKKLIFTVQDKQAKWQYVKTGERNEYFVEITSGVKPEQLVVIDGNFSLSHNANVTVQDTISYEQLNAQF